MHRVAADAPALPGTTKGHALGVVADPRLRRRVSGRHRGADQPRPRRDVDDGIGAARLHRADRLAAAEEGPVEVHPVHGAPVIQARMLRVVRNRPLLEAGHPRVVDYDVRHRDAPRQALPIHLLAHVERLEAAADLVCRRRAPVRASRSVMTTMPPSSWTRAAIAQPMPRAAPVTTQILPSSRRMLSPPSLPPGVRTGTGSAGCRPRRETTRPWRRPPAPSRSPAHPVRGHQTSGTRRRG